MPNFNPFSNDVEDTSFEQGMPVSQAAKNASKATSAQANAQMKAANQAIIDQLYGTTDSASQDQNTDAVKQAGTHANTSNLAQGAQAAMKAGVNPNQSPEEQAKMAKIRSELFGNYSIKFKSAQNGAQGLVTNLDQEMEKARQERKQKEMQRKQEEEEEEKQKKEEEEKQKQELAMPAGKKTGFMFGKKQQRPMSVELARTKTEVNRGTSG